MKIQIGEVYMTKEGGRTSYPNKTRRFLAPCLKEYGSIFVNRVNEVFKVAMGIGDVIVDRCGIHYEKHLFILLDSTIAPHHFKAFIEWIKTQDVYEDDYVFGDIQTSTFHMVIVKFPENLYDSFETFKKGDYSQMFDQETIDSFFEKFPDTKKILIKDHDYQIKFVGKINKLFNEEISPNEYAGELSLPPSDNEELFNDHLK